MSSMRQNVSSLMANLDNMSEAELLRWLAAHPVSGGEHQPDDDDEDDEDDDEDELDEDGNPTGQKGKSKKSDKQAGKLYTKDQLDDIVEKAVTDRLARERRSKDRNAAKDEGKFEQLATDLQKEIDEEWKPKAESLEALEGRIEELEAAVTAQIDAILEDLPKDLADLDLGEDEDAVKRLNWLVTKVLPKASNRRGSGDVKGNPPSPAPKNKQGGDNKKPVPAPVARRRF